MTPTDDLDDYALLSAKQVAEMTGVHLVTLSRWRSEGKGPPFVRLSKSRTAYPVYAYRRWVEQLIES